MCETHLTAPSYRLIRHTSNHKSLVCILQEVWQMRENCRVTLSRAVKTAGRLKCLGRTSLATSVSPMLAVQHYRIMFNYCVRSMLTCDAYHRRRMDRCACRWSANTELTYLEASISFVIKKMKRSTCFLQQRIAARCDFCKRANTTIACLESHNLIVTLEPG